MERRTSAINGGDAAALSASRELGRPSVETEEACECQWCEALRAQLERWKKGDGHETGEAGIKLNTANCASGEG
jgi:hypothetical protein